MKSSMRNTVAALVAALVVIACDAPAFGKTETVTGQVVDLKC